MDEVIVTIIRDFVFLVCRFLKNLFRLIPKFRSLPRRDAAQTLLHLKIYNFSLESEVRSERFLSLGVPRDCVIRV